MTLNHSPNFVCSVSFLAFLLPLLGLILSLPLELFWCRSIVVCMRLYCVVVWYCCCYWVCNAMVKSKIIWCVWDVHSMQLLWCSKGKLWISTYQIYQIYITNPFDTCNIKIYMMINKLLHIRSKTTHRSILRCHIHDYTHPLPIHLVHSSKNRVTFTTSFAWTMIYNRESAVLRDQLEWSWLASSSVRFRFVDRKVGGTMHGQNGHWYRTIRTRSRTNFRRIRIFAHLMISIIFMKFQFVYQL